MITPMLSHLIEGPFDSKDWIFEIKWDGFRALGIKTKQVEILSRNQISFNSRFPEIVKELKKLRSSFIVDGEIVILDEHGRSKFQLLQNYQKKKVGAPLYYLFDILFYDGKDITHLPLLERKMILNALLSQKSLTHIKYCEHVEGKGKALFKEALKHGLEGIMAKKADSTYQQKRSRDWLKIKGKMRQEMVIGGFTEPRGSRKKFGALLVGIYEKGKLHYCGHVGGGFSEQLLNEVYSQLKKNKTKVCPFVNQPKPNMPVTWLKPNLVCEIAFAEWTEEGILRQPVFKGMRIDKSPKEVKREKPLN